MATCINVESDADVQKLASIFFLFFILEISRSQTLVGCVPVMFWRWDDRSIPRIKSVPELR